MCVPGMRILQQFGFILCVCHYSLAIGCTNNEIRLVDGRDTFEGRLEVCKEAVWGTVCNNLWSTRSTSVVCRQLGIGDRGYYVNTFPEGAGPILLSNVNCTGSEEELAECPSVGVFEHLCIHREDVRIVCIPSATPPDCEDGSLRLVDGLSPHDGRLEVCQVGVWGTICSYRWDRNDATVACRQLGLNATASYIGVHQDGSGPILLSGVSCSGNESNITECGSSSAVLHDLCSHSNDVAIFCSVLTEPECTNDEMRLVDGRTGQEGRVEVCQEGLWGSVCDNGWLTQTSGLVVCRQLGINATDALFGVFGVGEGPIHLTGVQCTGTEDSIFNCSHLSSSDRTFFCYQSEPVGVICKVGNETAECEEGAIQLVDPLGVPTHGSGIVEVCVGERWSRVCHEYWDRREAEVVCQQLGFPTSGVMGFLVEGDYTGQVVSVSCENPPHTTIRDCFSSPYICLDQKYGAVICNATNDPECVNGDLRLAGSELTYGGRLEMCFLGVWGTICDDGWTISNAIVACRQLGFKTEGARFIHRYIPEGSGPIILDDLQCRGAEQSLVDCIHGPLNYHNCQRLENVGLYCLEDSVTVTESPTAVATFSQPPEVPPSSSSSLSTPAVVAVIAVLVLLLLVAVAMGLVCLVIHRRSSRSKFSLSLTNPHYERSVELQDVAAISKGSAANDYNTDIICSLGGGGGEGVTMRTGLTVPTSNVRGSFIRQFTEDFIIPLKHLTLLIKIGEGEFGIVHKAKLSSGSVSFNETVAVKTLKGVYSQEEVDAMLEEGLKLKHFQHQNVLSLIGVCVEASPAPYIVMPFMSNGSLLHYLRREKAVLVLTEHADEQTVDDVSKRLTTMCQQISKGMKYLASERFVHRDLAARNCMIDENYVIKIADFGLSEDIYSKTYFRQKSHTSVKLPVKWMALESLQEGVFSEKTDVWSFGVTCWEVFSGGKNPYPGVSPMGVMESLERGERMAQPNNSACTKEMYAIMKLCWEQDPENRPTFSAINQKIDRHLEEVAGYMNIETCLFPEMKHHEEGPRRTRASKKRSSSLFSRKKNDGGLKADAQVPEISISVMTPQGTEHFLSDHD